MGYISVLVDDEVHKMAKLQAISKGMTLKEYITSLIVKDSEKK